MKAETSIVCALCLLALAACKDPDLMPGSGWVQTPATPDKVPPTANTMPPMGSGGMAAGAAAAGMGGMAAGAAAAGMGGMAAGAAAAGMGGMAAGSGAAGMGAAGTAAPDGGMPDGGGG
jgi:hypothetical protein